MFGIGKKNKKNDESIDLFELAAKNKAAYDTPEMKATLRKLDEMTSEFDAQNAEMAKQYREEYEQGLIDWEMYNTKRRWACQKPLSVDEQTYIRLRKLGTDYKQGIISRDDLIKELDEYDVVYEDFELYPYTPDELGQELKLNGTLRAEVALVIKFADNKDLLLYDLKDIKEMVEYLLDKTNEWETKSYGFIKGNLNAILRQINLSEYSTSNKTVLSSAPGVVLSIEGIATGEDFEKFCAELLKRRGYTDVSLTPGSGDHGIDVLAEKDDISYAIQCKYYSNPVGNSAIQEAFSGKKLYKKDVAVVMTNSTFTTQAIEDAGQLGVKLWNGSRIEKWINEL